MTLEVILTPAEIARLPERDLSESTCVVFDVLRATSTMLTAIANGARRIFPVSTIEEAFALKRSELPGALLGGERGGVRPDGFDLGNSPAEYRPEVVAGRDIVSTTTNGTLALRACGGAKAVMAGAWLNLDALADRLLAEPMAVKHLLLVCAGTGENFALEDGLAAGGLIERLLTPKQGEGANDPICLSDAALAMAALYEAFSREPLKTMRASTNGRRLVEIGLGADVEFCAATTTLPWIATMQSGALEGTRVENVR